jgi:16S rRNA (adenine1518-N6/adenine1519-N6)-dimethyltransferase
MNKTELLTEINKIRLNPGRMLGQNFMVDGNMLDFIVKSASPDDGETIVEIGPGFGPLTKKLLPRAAVTAIEMDVKLYSYLKANIVSPNFKLVHADALRVDYQELIGGNSFRVVSNMPYSISSPFVMKMTELENPPVKMHLVLQKETAGRFAARPGPKEYGAVSVLVQTVYAVEKIRNIPPEVFYPKPDVTSSLVSFVKRDSIPTRLERQELSRFVKASFSKRRKKLVNNLDDFYDRAGILAFFLKKGIDENIRAERIGVESYLEMSREILRIYP